MEAKRTYLTCHFLLVFLILFSGKFALAAIHPSLRFQYLTTEEGLAQNTVDCIFQDSRGFMWFGTWNGLCRYDGYNFRTFRKSDGENGLPNNFIRAICQDESDHLWIGTAQGAVMYSLKSERFFLPDNLKSLKNIAVTGLACDREGGVWVSAENGGLFHVKPVPGDEQSFDCKKIDAELIGMADVNTVCVLKNGQVLAGTESGPFSVENGKLQRLFAAGYASGGLETQNIRCIYESSHGDWFFGTDNGLFRYQQALRKMSVYTTRANDQGTISHDIVMAVAEDLSGLILVGNLGGLDFFDPTTATVFRIRGRLDERETLNNEFVNSLFTDRNGNVWIGTEKGGVNKFSLFQKPFYSYRNHPDDLNSLSHNTVNSIQNDGDVLWVGTAGGGLNRIDKRTGKVVHFMQSPQNPQGICSNFIDAICLAPDRQLWVSSWGDGFGRLVSETAKTFKNYQHVPGNPNSLVSNFVSGIYPDDRGFFLVGTVAGLDLFDPKSESFFHFQGKFDQSVEAPSVGCILKDRRDYYWIGSRKGLFRIPAKLVVPTPAKLGTSDYQFFTNIPGDSLSIPGNYVISLLEDHQGTIWIGTYGNGICKVLDENDGRIQFKTYTKADGLCNDVVYAMEEDRQGNIWISTDNGLSKINPGTGTFQNFYTKDGLLNDQFYWTSSDSDEQGNLYFGGINGLNYFNPEQINYYPNLPKVVFTDFQVFNQSVPIGEKRHGNVILKQSIADTRVINLSYKDNVFSIEFSALDYFLPDKVLYSYKLEGVDQNWVTVSAARRFATYTNLSGGEYRFLVKAANSDGIWSDEPAELRIVVTPPFWETAWFRLGAVLFLAFAVMGYIRYRTRYLHEQKRKLELQVQERTEQIEEQKEKLREQADILQHSNNELAERQKLIEGQKLELEKQNKLIAEQRDEVIELNKKVNLINQLRLRFFTNISHEFRTPLTLIIDPLESLINSFKNDPPTLQTLKLINRNAQRLLHLINQLMYFRKIESGKMELRVVKGDLVSFLEDVFNSFHDLANHNRIWYSFSSAVADRATWFDPEKIENIFYNLLSNAFKFTPEGGRISMQVQFCKPFEFKAGLSFPYVRIVVSDSGTGIAPEHLPYVFDRFYQADAPPDNRQKGSGVGLALTQELVQALHGEISVESKIGQGTTFVVSLPYRDDDFTVHEIDLTGSVQAVNLQSKVDVITEELMQTGWGSDEAAGIDKSKPLLLIVEDNYDLRSFLVHTLKNDFRLLGAGNGKEGYDLARKYTPDLVVSDVMMPVMDGLEMCSRLKNDIQTSHIPVILLTAKAMVEHWAEGLETGADDYIPKPFNLKILQLKIHNLIESRRKLRQLFGRHGNPMPEESTVSPLDSKFLVKAYDVIGKNLQNENFSVEFFAREMAVSKSLLFKKIKAITGRSVTDFINLYKLEKAASMIADNPEANITDVAYVSGFNDPKYFSRMFRRVYGVPPSDYLKK